MPGLDFLQINSLLISITGVERVYKKCNCEKIPSSKPIYFHVGGKLLNGEQVLFEMLKITLACTFNFGSSENDRSLEIRKLGYQHNMMAQSDL